MPEILVERLRHYFMTYKLIPGEEMDVSIDLTFGREHAEKVIKASIEDYIDEFGG